MTKFLILITFLGCVHLSIQGNAGDGAVDECHHNPVTELAWDEYNVGKDSCAKKMTEHISKELKAAITYLELSAYFSSELNFRPGMAKFFLESAAEERGHAKRFMDYILMRGGQYKSIPEDIKSAAGDATKDGTLDVMGALKKAFQLELEVTENIKKVAEECENSKKLGKKDTVNDYHAVDYLTGEFLTEQHESLRQISGYIATLEQLRDTRSTPSVNKLQEIIFDQSLLQD